MDYINMHHKHYLFANDITYRAGLLAFTDHCLCDNRESGLVVGPYCANEDCKWDYANSSELHCVVMLCHAVSVYPRADA